MVLSLLKNFLNKKTTSSQSVEALDINICFKIVIVEFFDNIDNDNGNKLVKRLQQCDGIEIGYYDKYFDKSFLNLESRNIFDLIDKGQSIIEETNADVLIWGYRNNEHIRLNFQAKHQYKQQDQSFVSLLDCLYIPTSFLDDQSDFNQPLLNLIYGAAVSTVNSAEQEYKVYKKYLLKKAINKLSKVDSAKSLGIDYLPYVMNFLGIIYMSLTFDSPREEDFEVVENLFNNALKHQEQVLNLTHLGCIYYHLGQLSDNATKYINKKPASYFKGAIKNYQTSQKYLGKYTYPYDYGYICYKTSNLYMSYWKQTEDTQALRDAVFQLREAEKIYTQVLFPHFWSHIQGNLGHMLHNLGRITKSNDICILAISAYKNQQKVVTEKNNPMFWSYIQERIGEIYYIQGKATQNPEYLEDALACFHDALYIFEKTNKNNKVIKLKANISKAYQALTEAKN